MDKPGRRGKTNEEARRWQVVEWAIGIACAVLVMALLGLLLYEAISGTGEGPQLSVRQGAVSRAGDHFVLDLQVLNHGEATASDVVVEGRLGEETATVTIDYVPPGPGVKAALLFSHDPAGAEIDVAIRGYTRP